MAKFYQAANGDTGLRHGLTASEPIPDGAEVVEFDEQANSGLIDSLCGKNGFRWQDHSIVAGVIQRAGSPVTINPPRTKTDVEELTQAVIALALLTLDEINVLRQWDAALKAVFSSNATIANIRTAVAALPATNDRTRQQLIQAVRGKLVDV